jgi:hypothetical protein
MGELTDPLPIREDAGGCIVVGYPDLRQETA